MSYTINRIQMTRKHFEESTNVGRIRCVVIHSTAGRFPGDFNWLRRGGHDTDPERFVSVHYYITKTGAITQFVDDVDIAWHAGESEWVIDGVQMKRLNRVSVGIELENLNNGTDLYPATQVNACVWLTKQLVVRYKIPRSQLVRHLDISPGRKTDPAGFAWTPFVNDVYADTWLLWGTAYPLPVEQRGWAIPQLWLQHAQALGAATSNEIYLNDTRSARAFERGLIWYDKRKDRAYVSMS